MGVGVLNSVMFNCFHNRVDFGTILEGLYRRGVAQRVGRGIALLFHDCSTRRGWVVSSTPRPHFTPGKDPVHPFYRRLGEPQGRSGRVEDLVPTGIRSRTVQPIVSRYTDWATRSTLCTLYCSISFHFARGYTTCEAGTAESHAKNYFILTLIVLTWRIGWAHSNARK